MCSSPKPKARSKGKKGNSGGILGNMSADERSRFSERANLAQERRHQIKIKEKQQNLYHQNLDNKRTTRVTNNQKLGFGHWFLHASLKDIFKLLILGKSTSI